MPRTARLDTPGLLHHIMIRGIERRRIFNDDKDRENFIERLSILLPETKTQCYAWVFMPNHTHFLFRSGSSGISTLMRRLLTGYAVSYNRRHKRHGQLSQNRYKSIICEFGDEFGGHLTYLPLFSSAQVSGKPSSPNGRPVHFCFRSNSISASGASTAKKRFPTSIPDRQEWLFQPKISRSMDNPSDPYIISLNPVHDPIRSIDYFSAVLTPYFWNYTTRKREFLQTICDLKHASYK